MSSYLEIDERRQTAAAKIGGRFYTCDLLILKPDLNFVMKKYYSSYL